MPGISGFALGVTLAGAGFLYSGIKGATLSETIKGFIAGDPPAGTAFASSDPTATSVGGANGMVAAAGSGSSATVVNLALAQVGKPYVWDTPKSATVKNPPTFDCSGLTMWAYYQGGHVRLPHLAAGQYALLKKRPLGQAAPGDLVFYHNGADVYHVAMYVGNSTVVEAPEEGIPVRTRAIKATDADIMQTVGVYPAPVASTMQSRQALLGGNTPGGSPAANKALGRLMAAGYGWGAAQFHYLDLLWTRESGWTTTAKNPSSGAYGIAQALPETKYPRAGTAEGGSSAQAQIAWGLKYIKERYGSPQNAWAHETSMGWY